MIYREKIPEYFNSSSDAVTFGVNTATILGGFVAVETLILIWIQLIIQNRQSRLERTYQFSEKLQTPEFYTHFSKTRYFLTYKEMDDEEKWSFYINQTDEEMSQHIYITLTFFEDLAMLYNAHYIERDIVRKLMLRMIINYYEESEWLRSRNRKYNNNSKLYKEWESLYRKLTRWQRWKNYISSLMGGTP